MPSTGKAKLGNVSFTGQVNILTWKTFLCFMWNVFDVKKTSGIFCTYRLNESEKIFFNSTTSTFFDSDSTRSNNATPTSAKVKKKLNSTLKYDNS